MGWHLWGDKEKELNELKLMSELSQAWTRLQYYIEHDIRILEIIKSSRTNEEKVLAIINEYKKEDNHV